MYKCLSLTPKGFAGLVYTDAGLYELVLPEERGQLDACDGWALVGAQEPLWVWQLTEDLTAYFSGERVTFRAPVDVCGYPPFFRRVLAACTQIPWGERRTYRWLAEQANSPKAVRAAGQAMANNRTPVVVPCHRVLRSDGGLGGFSGGLHWKETLLKLEVPSDAD